MRMTLGNDESLEDYEERFQLSYKRARCTLDPKSLKLVLLRGVREDLLATLNLLARGDMYLKTLSLQMDTMHIKRKKGEVERTLAIFCPRCTRRHPRNECPLNLIEVCSVYEENHSTKNVLLYLD